MDEQNKQLSIFKYYRKNSKLIIICTKDSLIIFVINTGDLIHLFNDFREILKKCDINIKSSKLTYSSIKIDFCYSILGEQFDIIWGEIAKREDKDKLYGYNTKYDETFLKIETLKTTKNEFNWSINKLIYESGANGGRVGCYQVIKNSTEEVCCATIILHCLRDYHKWVPFEGDLVWNLHTLKKVKITFCEETIYVEDVYLLSSWEKKLNSIERQLEKSNIIYIETYFTDSMFTNSPLNGSGLPLILITPEIRGRKRDLILNLQNY